MSNIFVGTVQLKGKTAAAWAATNPVLLAREPGIETDTAKVKYGDGATTWNALPYSGGGTTTTTSSATAVGFNTSIPLDTNGAGKVMPQTLLTSNFAFSVAPGAVEDGTCQLCLVGDGSHSPDLSSFTSGNAYAYVNTSGARNLYIFAYQYGSPIYVGIALPAVGTGAPSLTSATVDDVDATKINLVWSRAMDSNISDVTAFTISAGHSLTAHTRIDSTHTYLATSTPFTQTETAKTLAYVAPVLNPMKDLSANLLVGFSGTGITNNVTSPQITAAVVANSTPTKIDLTWSDTISSTVPAASAFAVSAGHALTAHAYVDSTHTQLTTSTPFTGGEAARTLSYTVPGSNPIKDLQVISNLGLAITGKAITNNVVSSALVTENFNQADGTLIGKTSTTGAKTWAQIGAGSVFDVMTSSNKAIRNASGASWAGVNLGAQTSFTATATLVGSNGSGDVGFLLRSDGSIDNFVHCYFNGFGTLVLCAHDNTGNIGSILTQGGYTNDGATAYVVVVTCTAANAYSVTVGGVAAAGCSGTIANFATNPWFGIKFAGGGTIDDFSVTSP